uniref:CUGBP Elav-like family member 2 n=1 Tax=Ascaris lumbricoides TaxID=6252 RepID=A0A0M3IHV7_ASCLU
MSLPRMCALPSSSDVEKEKQRLTAAAMFPGLQFMGFPTVTTAGSSVFPPNMAAQISLFNPHLQQYYANFIHQQQMLQNLHSHSPQSRIGSTFHFAV